MEYLTGFASRAATLRLHIHDPKMLEISIVFYLQWYLVFSSYAKIKDIPLLPFEGKEEHLGTHSDVKMCSLQLSHLKLCILRHAAYTLLFFLLLAGTLIKHGILQGLFSFQNGITCTNTPPENQL